MKAFLTPVDNYLLVNKKTVAQILKVNLWRIRGETRSLGEKKIIEVNTETVGKCKQSQDSNSEKKALPTLT